MRQTLFQFALSLLTVGCSIFEPIPEYSLTKVNDLLVSNSPHLFSSESLKKKDGKVKLDIRMQIKNSAANKSYSLFLDQAKFIANESSTPASCKSFEGARNKIELSAGESVTVQCNFWVAANSSNRLLLKDTNAQIALPASHDTMIVMSQSLSVEDFE